MGRPFDFRYWTILEDWPKLAIPVAYYLFEERDKASEGLRSLKAKFPSKSYLLARYDPGPNDAARNVLIVEQIAA